MAPLSTSLLLFCLLGSTLAVAREPYNQEEQNRDATCDVSNYHTRTVHLATLSMVPSAIGSV